uniref:Uncharacterized protein n=1 Tax=Anguilla anguilla TaxID=7936 RepID=A0A0E9QGS0_ANGAN
MHLCGRMELFLRRKPECNSIPKIRS